MSKLALLNFVPIIGAFAVASSIEANVSQAQEKANHEPVKHEQPKHETHKSGHTKNEAEEMSEPSLNKDNQESGKNNLDMPTK